MSANSQIADSSNTKAQCSGDKRKCEAPIEFSQKENLTENARLAVRLDSASDETLLEQIRAGKEEALTLLFRRYATLVRILGERILGNAAEAEDLVQEVFLFIFRKADLFDRTRGSARSWLVQVAYHRAFDRRRYLVSRGFYSSCELDEGALGREPFQGAVSCDNSLAATLGEDMTQRMEKSLSPIQRHVLRLRFVEGHTVDEIARILGQSAGNIRNHYYRALEKMRKEILASRKPST